MHNDRELTTYTSEYKYIIPSLQRLDAGFYRCVVRNRMGALLQRRSEVHVAYMGNFMDTDQRKMVSQGHAAVLNLLPITSCPRPQVTWFREGHKIIPSNRICFGKCCIEAFLNLRGHFVGALPPQDWSFTAAVGRGGQIEPLSEVSRDRKQGERGALGAVRKTAGAGSGRSSRMIPRFTPRPWPSLGSGVPGGQSQSRATVPLPAWEAEATCEACWLQHRAPQVPTSAATEPASREVKGLLGPRNLWTASAQSGTPPRLCLSGEASPPPATAHAVDV
uniref:uncharacterized protein LOC118536997 isoform X1 n=1 Tax=Halichoerus grypus TaxID=9711 RepID=UPI001659EF76|nr:uncharacterized protein LOC118536997 isoform X1 [Halichoerus grypus]XP_035950177.1 uncharacterized protein LOC118536997 isoform X1 [Halichoerus grypus]